MAFLFDGHCRLCVNGAGLMLRLARPGVVELVDFQVPGALASFPEVTHERCMRAAQLVTIDGRVFSGLEAIVRALSTRPILGLIAGIYFIPGVRQAADVVYRWVAANRHRFMGRSSCHDAACALHRRSQDASRRTSG